MTAPTVAALGPGLYLDLPHEVYHGQRDSLSRSGVQLLLPPSCPAMFRWRQDHPQEPKDIFDFGNAAHAEVLGDGLPVDVLDFPDWRTKLAQVQRDESRDAGRVPLLRKDWERVEAMAAAIKDHPLAARLLDPDAGVAEPSLIWQDADTGCLLRCRPDFLPHRGRGRLLVPDYKTAESAHPDEFVKSAVDYGYHIQAAMIIDAVKAVGLAADAAVVFIAQEKTPPYLVSVIELDERALRIGRALLRHAIEIFQHCQRTGRWPGYSDEVELAELPSWYLRRFDED